MVFLGLAHADAVDGNAAVGSLKASDETGLGAGAARSVDHGVDLDPHVVGLLQKFHRAINVAQRPHRVRPAARNHVGLATTAAHLPGDIVEGRRHVGAAGNVAYIGAQQVVEKDVAAVVVLRTGVLDPTFQDNLTLKTQFGRRRRRLTGVIGLYGALGDDRVGTLFQGLPHKEFQLARLVAAGGETGAVVALDEEPRTIQKLGQVVHGFQGRRAVAETDPGESGKMHGLDLS